MNKNSVLKKFFLNVCMLSVLLLINVSVHASEEDEGQDAWVGIIDEVSIVSNRIIIGDLLSILSDDFSVEDPQGRKLNRSTLQPGLLVSIMPQYRNNLAYVDKIIVLE